MSKQRIKITVVVFGDLGRSPRMQFHALALANSIAEVTLIGELGSPVYQHIEEHPHIRCRYLNRRKSRSGKLALLLTALQLVRQSISLWLMLFKEPKPSAYLVQVPPALPVFTICRWMAKIQSARLVLDWHNFGYTVLAQKVGENNLLVKCLKVYEQALAQKADAHICVSRAMQQELSESWKADNVHVLYDQPGQMFKVGGQGQKLELLRQVQGNLSNKVADTDGAKLKTADNLHRPFVIISPSSWSSDDDFLLLLKALPLLDQRLSDTKNNIHVLFVLTGNGPYKAIFQARFTELKLVNIEIQMPWLETQAYPALLSGADLGLSLHRSTSKLDLPMKILDMQGAGLVVCVLDYGPCLSELIQHKKTGLLFKNADVLVSLIENLLQGFPEKSQLQVYIQENLYNQSRISVTERWQQLAEQVLAYDFD